MKSKGTQILLDLYDCNFNNLNNLSKAKIKNLFSDIVKDSGLTEIGNLWYFFDHFAFTMVIAISESHVAIHTWPEDNYVSVDIFVCNYSKDNSAAAMDLCQRIVKLFSSKKIKRKIIKR